MKTHSSFSRDEINIPLEHQSAPLFMGVSLNATSGFRPAAQFLVETPLSSAEVGRRYAQQTQSEADESTAIRFVPQRLLLKLTREESQLTVGQSQVVLRHHRIIYFPTSSGVSE